MDIETPVSDGHRYGCWGTKRGGTKVAVLNAAVDLLPRDNRMKPWYSSQRVAMVTTPWLPIGCGHDIKHRDPSCSGCPNLESKNG